MRGEVLVALIRFEWQIGPTNYVQTEVQQVEPPSLEEKRKPGSLRFASRGRRGMGARSPHQRAARPVP